MDVISVPGRLVRDPVTRRVVDQTPVSINHTDPSWSRLLADGDVVEAPEGHLAPQPAASPPITAEDAAPAAPEEPSA